VEPRAHGGMAGGTPSQGRMACEKRSGRACILDLPCTAAPPQGTASSASLALPGFSKGRMLMWLGR